MKQKNQAAVSLGKLGGRASTALLSADQLRERASLGGKARWQGKSAEQKAAHSALMREGRKPKIPL